MKIETPRLTLRDFTPADGPALHAILGDGEVMAFAEPPYTPAQTQAFLEQFCIARRGEDPAVSIRPSCQGLGTGKIETAPENSSAVSPCLVRFGEGT